MEKNREFLNYFWDLASEDDIKRLQASHDIIQYLKKPDKGEIDIDYVSKRLVRGLSSSRSHARAGFSTSLTELISLKFIKIDEVILLIDETTKTSGSLKRNEIRDFMLGRLFGILSILKSQTLLINKSHIEYVLSNLLQLHSWKGWMRELVAESILFLISIISCEHVEELVLPKLVDLVQTPLDELAAWQIVLLCGLENYAKIQPLMKKQIKSILPQDAIVTSKSLDTLKATLVLATHGFPKVSHNIISFIVTSMLILIFGNFVV